MAAIQYPKSTESSGPRILIEEMLRILHSIRTEEIPHKLEISADCDWLIDVIGDLKLKFGTPKISDGCEFLRKKADYLDALGDLYINDHGHSMLNLATDRLEDTPQIRDEKWKAWLAEKERNIAEGRKLKRQAKIARQASEVWKNKDTGACRNTNQVIRGSPKKELVEIAAIKYRERRGAIGSQERREFIRFAQLLYEAGQISAQKTRNSSISATRR